MDRERSFGFPKIAPKNPYGTYLRNSKGSGLFKNGEKMMSFPMEPPDPKEGKLVKMLDFYLREINEYLQKINLRLNFFEDDMYSRLESIEYSIDELRKELIAGDLV